MVYINVNSYINKTDGRDESWVEKELDYVKSKNLKDKPSPALNTLEICYNLYKNLNLNLKISTYQLIFIHTNDSFMSIK